MMSPIFVTSWALTSISSASVKPRSAYTLPEPLSIAVTLALLGSCFCFLQPLPDEIHLRLRRSDALLRLLLKAMQDVDPAGDSDGIDNPKSAALTARPPFQTPPGPQPLPAL